MIEYTVKVYPDGDKYWYLGGKVHREDGPAVVKADGTKIWCLYDELHNEHGPAYEKLNGYKEWWLNGRYVTEEEHKRRTSKAPCQGKVVVIDGVEYELKEV